MQINHVIHGDCLAALPKLPRECIDLVVTDPPYLVGYRDRSGRTVANDANPLVLEAFLEVAAVMRPNTFCVSFYGWNRVDAFFAAWKAAGLRPVGHIVWKKGYASKSGFLRARHEQAYLLAKGNPPKPRRPLDDVWQWDYSGNVDHPTQKSVEILRPLIETFSRRGDVVLDPFAGSGSTLVAAAQAGRKFIGIELDASYCAVAEQRISAVLRKREGPRCQATSRTDPLTTSSSDPRLMISSLPSRCSRWPG